jgi:hypothetical protein
MPRVSREQMVEESRPKRVPVNEANRNKLTVNGLDHDNFYYRWVNDTEDRMSIFLQAGYEFVDQNGTPVGDGGVDQSAGKTSKFSKPVGFGVTAYLMRIPRSLWLEDQKRKEDDLKEVEADMKRAAQQNSDYGKFETGSARTNKV